jgi:phage-related protein
MGSSLQSVRDFPAPARQRIGFQLERVQEGLEALDWKPMPAIGAGVREIRVHTENEYRVCYAASFKQSIYVLHAFVKKTRKTSRTDLQVAKARYQEILAEERGRR